MYLRLTRAEFEKQKGPKNKKAFKKIVDSGPPPGILAYVDRQPAGWCAVAPRKDYSALQRSHILQPIDDQPVWSITCFFVAKPFRRKGLTVELIKSAIKLARQHGAKIVEAYPKDPGEAAVPDVFVWNGLMSAFRKVGFQECLRRSKTRPIMRYVVSKNSRE